MEKADLARMRLSIILLVIAIIPLIVIPIWWKNGFGDFSGLLLVWALLDPFLIASAGFMSYSIKERGKIRTAIMDVAILSAVAWIAILLLGTRAILIYS